MRFVSFNNGRTTLRGLPVWPMEDAGEEYAAAAAAIGAKWEGIAKPVVALRVRGGVLACTRMCSL